MLDKQSFICSIFLGK